MKDITLKITGKQLYTDREEDQMEFITDGKLYERNGSLYVIYEETELSGMAGAKTSLKVDGNSIRMRRLGGEGFNAELYFEEGKRFSSIYSTPYGPMGIEVLTKVVESNMDLEAGKGRINVEYEVSLEGMTEGKNKLTIDVM